jgi:hypothetical protein
MAIVHCRYGQDHGDDGVDRGDGWVWLCLGAIGPEDFPGEDLDGYHNARPLTRCSCGYDPRPPAPEPDGQWRPGHL